MAQPASRVEAGPPAPARRREAVSPVPSPAFVCPQRSSTGWAGAASIIALYAGYASFQARLDKGGPDWTALLGFHTIARDYVDIFLCILTTFTVMVVFEKALRAARWAALGLAAATAVAVANAPVTLLRPWGATFNLPEAIFGVTLAALWTLLGLDLALRRRAGLAKPVPNRREVSWRAALRSGFFRWFALWGVVSVALVIYETSRLYAGIPPGSDSYYLNWRVTAAAVWWLVTVGGLPYCVLTVKRRSNFKEDRNDPGLILNLVALHTARGGPKELYRLVSKRRVRVVLLDLLVKFFWAPLMVTFVFSECGAFHSGMQGSLPVFARAGLAGGLSKLTSAFFGGPGEEFVDSTYRMVYHALFVIDCTLGLLGYVTSSRWLGTKSKSVEFTVFGWGAALACYPPFNNVTGTLFPYDVNPHGPYWIFSTLAFHHAMMVLTILLFVVYVWATIAFGLRFSNLTHRGILNNGPYRYIRHPAYAAKNFAWWTESLGSFGSPWQFVYLAGLNTIYILRAVTEERHLSHYEDYRQYKKLVRWRFIPGVV